MVIEVARSMHRINTALDDHEVEYQPTMIECSFLSDMSMDIIFHASRECLSLRDFVIPYEENFAYFQSSSNVKVAGKL